MITIANPEKYRAGLYERLSNENIEVGNCEVIVTNEDEQESGSISTQKLFLRNFCKDNNIQVYDDYTDDGVSGATFDRPDFNRMIKDIENKKIIGEYVPRDENEHGGFFGIFKNAVIAGHNASMKADYAKIVEEIKKVAM